MAAMIALVLGGLSVLAVAQAQKADISDLKTQAVRIDAHTLPFERADPERRDFGRLVYQGGLVLSANHPAFGGYSGLSLSADGTQMLAVSDAGSWLTARLVRDNGQLTGLADARIGPLRQKDGRPLQRRRHRDAEEIVSLEPRNGLDGRYFIAFEQFHRLDEYEFRNGDLRGPVRRGNLPVNLRRLSGNKGLEGVARLRGGSHAGGLILFAERKLNDRGDHTGSLVRDGKAYPIFLTRAGRFDITALASLGDGSLLVLQRRFIRSSMKLDIRLRLVRAEAIKPGARLSGEVLLEADRRYAIDNLEAMAVSETASGETLVTLMSDDNFNFFQSTLLLQFRLRTD